MLGWSGLVRGGKVALVAGLCGWAGAASANPLVYGVDTAQSGVEVSVSVNSITDVTPDFTELIPGGDEFPFIELLTGANGTTPSSSSTLTADVGLPSNFDSSDIEFSNLVLDIPFAGGTVVGGLMSVPLDLLGSSLQLLYVIATVSSLTLTLDDPFTATMTPSGNLDEWIWAGVANVTLSGVFEPSVIIPTQPTVSLGAFPFSQQVTMPLAGTFSGDGTHTQVTLGIPTGTLQNQSLALPPVQESIDLLDLGVVTAFFHFDSLALVDISTAVVYTNTTPIPEPGTALLVGVGLAGLAVRRRR